MKGPILVVGAGAMGGAMIAGWRRAGLLAELIIRDPNPGPEALAAASAGARLNPPEPDLARARWVVLAVKPQVWRTGAAALAPLLAAEATVVSVVAGIAAKDLADVFPRQSIARAMPTLGVAIGQGSIAVWSAEPGLAEPLRSLFAPLGAVSRLDEEELMHAATAASGSAPAYLYAFIEALEGAAATAGLPAAEAQRMVRSTITGAAALLAASGDDPAALRRRVTSPGGTTEAALAELMGPKGLGPLLQRAVGAATARSRELGR